MVYINICRKLYRLYSRKLEYQYLNPVFLLLKNNFKFLSRIYTQYILNKGRIAPHKLLIGHLICKYSISYGFYFTYSFIKPTLKSI